ncbi:S-layer homology domain-containing protein [Dysosmobacter sp.]
MALNEAGIINGYGNGQFGPKDVIKRSHIAAIIWRINQYQAK